TEERRLPALRLLRAHLAVVEHVLDRDLDRDERRIGRQLEGAVAHEVAGRVQHGRAVDRRRVAEEERPLDRHVPRLELIRHADHARREAVRVLLPHAVALEAVERRVVRDVVLLGDRADRVLARDGELLRAELVRDEDTLVAEGRRARERLRHVAALVHGDVVDALTVLVDRVAEAERADDLHARRPELVGDVGRRLRERRPGDELVALEVVEHLLAGRERRGRAGGRGHARRGGRGGGGGRRAAGGGRRGGGRSRARRGCGRRAGRDRGGGARRRRGRRRRGGRGPRDAAGQQEVDAVDVVGGRVAGDDVGEERAADGQDDA